MSGRGSASKERPQGQQRRPRTAPRAGRRNKRSKLLNSPESTAELILTRAELLIAKRGIDGLRLSEIAAALGITLPGIYRHYSGGREEVLEGVATRMLSAMAAMFPDDGTGGYEVLMSGVRDFVRHWFEHPGQLRLIVRDFAEPSGLPALTNQFGPPGVPEATGALSAFRARVTGLLERSHTQDGRRLAGYPEFFNLLAGTTFLGLLHPLEARKPNSNEAWKATEAHVLDVIAAWLRP